MRPQTRRPAALSRPRLALAGAIAGVLAAALARAASDAEATNGGLQEIVVTAQKRVENLQTVPISVQAFDAKKLTELHVSDFASVAKYLPSLSFQTLGPSQAQIYFRGLTNGSDGLKTGTQPMVGVYLDEQPVTTIGTSLDVHVYDMERIEALSGPQGTLFGASSMAGTVRYITNKPDTRSTYAGYDLAVNQTRHGGTGEKAEGYVNWAINDRAAIRLVGFGERDAGYINNVAGPHEVYPTSGVVRDNAALRKDAYNNVGTSGGRLALKVNLDDQWTISPSVAYQKQGANGAFGFEPFLGHLNVATYGPQRNDDQWYQSALTITGKIGNFDLIYSGGYNRRTIDNVVDYSDYSYAYDVYYASNPAAFGNQFRNNAGQFISPAQYTVSHDLLTKRTHEVRLSTQTDRLHWVIGAFYEEQRDDNYYKYLVTGLADSLSITGQPGNHYLNAITRLDTDRAAFTDLTYDLTQALALTVGGRVFDYRSSASGFFGFPSAGGFYGVGEALCDPLPTPQTAGRYLPCENVHARTEGGKYTDKVTLNYKLDHDKLVYATYSTGFRAGGFNRNPFVGAYRPDFLTNYEIGWKTQLADRTVRFNGALFRENWTKSQYGVNGQYAITQIINAGGARTEGTELQLDWLPIEDLTLTLAGTYLWKHELTGDACKSYDQTTHLCTNVVAPIGTKMPVAPALKANFIARYEWTIGDFRAHAQGAAVYQSTARSLLALGDNAVAGDLPSYTAVDASLGIARGSWTAGLNVENAFDSHGEVGRYLACSPSYCTNPYVVPVHPRMVSLQFGQKF